MAKENRDFLIPVASVKKNGNFVPLQMEINGTDWNVAFTSHEEAARGEKTALFCTNLYTMISGQDEIMELMINPFGDCFAFNETIIEIFKEGCFREC